MILKKPYGFLIKHFKAINLILLVPVLYITLCFSDISKFFQRYVNNNYITKETGISGSYITIWLLAAIVFMILVDLIIYTLMKKKKKKTTFYILSIIYFFILFMLAMITYGHMTTIEIGKVSTTTSTFIKDLLGFTPYPGYLIAIITLFNGIGFNIKTLKFDQDIDLQITDEDNEEIEIGTNAENISYKKTIIHLLRELKYYVLENKFIFTCILALFLLVLASNIYINVEVMNKKYTIKQGVQMNNIVLSVEDSYITNTDMGGNQLAKNKYYIVLKTIITNTSGDPYTIKEGDLRIRINKKNYYPSFDRSSNFLDIGRSYLGKAIQPKNLKANNSPTYTCEKGYLLNTKKRCVKGSEKKDPILEDHYSCPNGYVLNKDNSCDVTEEASTYVIVYEIEKEQIKSSYELKILNDLNNKIGELNPSYRIVKFRPKNILNKEDLGSSAIGKEIKLDKTLLKDTTYKLKDIKFEGSYRYSYDFCIDVNNCYLRYDAVTSSQGSRLIIIDDEIKYDKTSSYYINSNKKFYEDFAKIKYTINDKTYISRIKDVTPQKLKDKRVYEITQSILVAKDLELILTFRNQTITIPI